MKIPRLHRDHIKFYLWGIVGIILVSLLFVRPTPAKHLTASNSASSSSTPVDTGLQSQGTPTPSVTTPTSPDISTTTPKIPTPTYSVPSYTYTSPTVPNSPSSNSTTYTPPTVSPPPTSPTCTGSSNLTSLYNAYIGAEGQLSSFEANPSAYVNSYGMTAAALQAAEQQEENTLQANVSNTYNAYQSAESQIHCS